MTIAVLPSSSSTPFSLEKYHDWPAPPAKEYKADGKPPTAAAAENNEEVEEEERPGQFDIWNAIQSQKTKSSTTTAGHPPAPYVHPLLRRSSSLLSQKSLEVCTESLGSETGSDDFFSLCDDLDYFYSPKMDVEPKEERNHLDYMHEYKQELTIDKAEMFRVVVAEEDRRLRHRGKELTSVNYHSTSRRLPLRTFPPPLSSISRRDGPCLHMRPHRRDGRLVVEAVAVPSQNYLHAQREGGRLLLSFIDATFDEPSSCFNVEKYSDLKQEQQAEDHEEAKQEAPEETEAMQLAAEDQEEMEDNNNCYVEEDEEEEEEVELVDRGTVVEVKVSTQPQQQSSATKVLRSSVVINKFVGDTPLVSRTAIAESSEEPVEKNEARSNHNYTTPTSPVSRRSVPTTTTTAAAAVVAASSLSFSADGVSYYPPSENKLLFTSKRRNREELLHNMRRCNQLRRPLFIWEPYCVATS